MTISELIDSLQRMTIFGNIPPDTKVKSYDAETGSYEDITGFLHNAFGNTLELQTDSDDADEEEG